MTHGQLLADHLTRMREWTLMLLDDFDEGDWRRQPGPGLAHPLWICGHLAVAQHLLIHVRCLGGSGVIDPDFAAHFAIGAPVKPVEEHDYPSHERILATMADVHRKTVDAVAGMSDALLAEPAFGLKGAKHPHYDDKRGAVAHCHRHEAFHAGQLATIRRLGGKSFLR